MRRRFEKSLVGKQVLVLNWLELFVEGEAMVLKPDGSGRRRRSEVANQREALPHASAQVVPCGYFCRSCRFERAVGILSLGQATIRSSI